MAAGGVPMRTLQAWIGHSSVTTTEIYADYASDPTGGRDLAHRAFEAATCGGTTAETTAGAELATA
jgi:integrase